MSNQGLGTEYDFIGTQYFSKNIELDLTDTDGNQSMSTSEYLPLNQTISGKSIGGGFDGQDYYRFSLTQISDVFILLNGLTASSGFEVIKDLNNNWHLYSDSTNRPSESRCSPGAVTFAPNNCFALR